MENQRSTPVACTLTDEQNEKRSTQVRSTLVSHYMGAEKLDGGYTLRFNGTDEALLAVASFTVNELQCCSFAEYTINVAPPYGETRLTITGPEGTKAMFGEGLVDRLEAETA